MQQMGSTNNPMVSLRHVHRWRMALSGVVILVAGITLGVAGTLLFMPTERREPPEVDVAVAGMVMRFQGELKLTPEQVEKIRTVLHQRMKKLEELRQEARPKIEEQLQGIKEEINKVLTEEQRQGWQKITERLDREFHRGFRQRGGPGRGEGGPPGGGRGDWRGGPPGPDGGRERLGFDPNGPRPQGFGRPEPNDVRWQRRSQSDRDAAGSETRASQGMSSRDPNNH